MAKPWEELHTQIATDDEFNKAIAYKGLTCTRPPLALSRPLVLYPTQPARCANAARSPRKEKGVHATAMIA